MEEYKVPFLYDRESPVDEETEKAEVLAKAFNDSAGSYFQDYKELGDRLKSASNKMYASFISSALLVLIGVFLLISRGQTWNFLPLIFGLVSVGAGYYFRGKKIDIHSQREELNPDEEIDYLSKMYLPVYIVPYSDDKSLVMDSRELGDSVEVELNDYDMNPLISALENFEKSLDEYNDMVSGRDMLNHGAVEEKSKELTEEKIIEKGLLESLDKVDNATSPASWIENSFSFHVHKPESDFIQGMNFINKYKEQSFTSELPLFNTLTDPEEAEENVEDLKGIEVKASSSDILNKTVEWKNSISEIISGVEGTLERNMEITSSNYESLSILSEDQMKVQVCPKCLSEQVNDDSGPTKGQPVENYFNLEEYILNEFETPIKNMDNSIKCDECNAVLESIDKEIINCPECNAETIKYKSPEGSPRNKAERYIRTNVEVTLDDMPMRYIFNIPLCTYEDGDWYCEDHGKVDPMTLPALGDVFGHTADNAWDEMKEPVKKRCADSKEKAMDNLNEYRSQKMQLAPYEQTEIKIESIISQINGDVEAARTAMKEMGWHKD